MARQIVILSGSHLCHNPRVVKEATTLANAGYTIEVIGAWFDPALKSRDMEMLRYLPFHFMPSIDGTNSSIRRLRAGMSRKIASVSHRLAGIESRRQLGYSFGKLFSKASRRKPDLYIAHSESAMAVAVDLRSRGRLVGVDMEDWFSEDLLPEARKLRPLRLLRNYERELLTGNLHATCPSNAMSDALATEFACNPPTVVYNAFPWTNRDSIDGVFKDRKDRRIPTIHWFSQTIGPGRGLEDLFAALPLLKNEVEVHLRGNLTNEFDGWLADVVPPSWRSRILVHELVANTELLSRIAEHDIGFAGEMTYCRSRDLTVTNKILQYLLAGLAVVASDTAGQCEVAEQAPGGVHLYRSGDATGLAACIDGLLSSRDALPRAKAAALDAARRTFCWERQEAALLGSVERSLHSRADKRWNN